MITDQNLLDYNCGGKRGIIIMYVCASSNVFCGRVSRFSVLSRPQGLRKGVIFLGGRANCIHFL